MTNNNKNSNKTTTLKTLLMLSIISMALVIGGGEVIPAYAQTVWSADADSDIYEFFWDLIPPKCIVPGEIYAIGRGFTTLTDGMTIWLTYYPINHNDSNIYTSANQDVDFASFVPSAIVAWREMVDTDVLGEFFDSPILVMSNPGPGTYNLIVDEDSSGIFNQDLDAIDAINKQGLTVLPCVLLMFEQDDQEVRAAQLGESYDVTATGQSYPDSDYSHKANVYITTHGNINTPYTSAGDSTITDLSDISVWSKDVYIGSDGAFTETITWTPTTPGEYNIILDMNNDDTYTPGIDIIDYPDEVGFTVTDIIQEEPTVEVTKSGKRTRDGISEDPVNIDGKSLDGSDPNKRRKISAIPYTSQPGPVAYTIDNLSDISVWSKYVYIGSDGEFTETITWTPTEPGIYNIILDMDDNNTYELDTDIIDYSDEIGFIVVDSREGHNDIVHLGDKGDEREVYDSYTTQNIYTLAKNLHGDVDVDIYTISEKLLKENNDSWSTWGDAYDDGDNSISLAESAVAVYDNKKIHTAHTSADGTLFLSTWKYPFDFFDSDFINSYGKKFNVVIDANQNGVFDSGDKEDTHNVYDISNWLSNHKKLGYSFSVNDDKRAAAVSEYKEFLNDKLYLEADGQLDPTNSNYGLKAKAASFKYLCSEYLTPQLFEIVKVGAETGFRLLLNEEYYVEERVSNGRFVYDSVGFDRLDVSDSIVSIAIASKESDSSWIVINDLTVENSNVSICGADIVRIDNILTYQNGSYIYINAGSVSIDGFLETPVRNTTSKVPENSDNGEVCIVVADRVDIFGPFMFDGLIFQIELEGVHGHHTECSYTS